MDALLDAAARILAEGGLEAANTNRIAEVAGVSVGSLYQYFPNKEALVAALVERRVEEEVQAFDAALAERRDLPLRELVGWLAKGFVAMHAAERALYEALLPVVPRLDRERFVRARVARATAHLARALADQGDALARPDPALAAFVALRAAEALVHTAVLERPALLASGLLAAEIEALLAGYLCRRAP